MSTQRQQAICRTWMPFDCFKVLLRCLRFDNWHTNNGGKLVDKFEVVSEIWNIFL